MPLTLPWIRDRLDRMGLVLSGLCAVHCVATAVVVAALGVGGSFLLNPAIHRVGLAMAMVIAGAPSPAIRNKSSRQLIEWGFANFSSRRLLSKGAAVGEAMVQGGSSTSVPLLTEAPVFVNLPVGEADGVNLSARYRGPIDAPIRRGDEVATLRIAIAGQEPHDVPLIAGADVREANAWQRLRNGVTGLFR